MNLGTGTLKEGCQTIIGEILGQPSVTHHSSTELSALAYPSRFTGQLPSAPDLAAMQQQWQQLYYARNQNQACRIQILQTEGIRYSETAFRKLCTDLGIKLNQWLNTPEFRTVDRILRNQLARTDDAQIILEISDPQIRKLPWHLWQLFEAYPCATLSFSACNWQPLSPHPASASQPRILAAFGNSHGLDLAADFQTLSDLPNTRLDVLQSPSLNQLHEKLWQPQGWDIFFFAGHSQTDGDIGVIDLNEQERLSIHQIKHALSKAIANGLKIAIFNSCDGLGLAQQLLELPIPYVVVMKEPVPDHSCPKIFAISTDGLCCRSALSFGGERSLSTTGWPG
ncbi:MAG: hypothetical protein HC800_22080 [Phormidesmis sp. RL_2_1]|nr:hypothetical protein [Phormidesmis sp. RL_2_1]